MDLPVRSPLGLVRDIAAEGGIDVRENSFSKQDSLAIKGAAILLMLCLHCFRVPELYAGFPVNFAPFPEDLINRICAYGKVCVGIFAFISGYGLSKAYRDMPDRDLSRACLSRYYKSIRAFWPIYLLCLLAGVVIDGRTMQVYCSGGLGRSALNLLLGGLGLNHLFRTPMFVNEWWYLSAMVVFIFITPLLQRMVSRYGWALPVFLLVALPRILSIGFQGGTEIFTFFSPLLLGVIFAQYGLFEKFWSLGPKRPAAGRLCKLLLTGCAAFLGYKAYFLLPADQYWEVYYGLIPLSFLLFFHTLVKGVPVLEDLFVFLGKHSGNIYFIHTVFLYVYLKKPLYSMPWFGLTPLALLALSLGFSMVLEESKALVRKLKSL